MTVSALLYLAAMLLLFVGERLVAPAAELRIFSGVLGALILAASVFLRLRRRSAAEGDSRRAHGWALRLTLLGAGSILLYFAGLRGTVEALGMVDETAARFTQVLSALWPVLWLAATLPLLLVDHVVADTPRAVQPRRLAHAFDTGLVLAFAVALAFPVNYLASRHRKEVDLRYLKTTAAGESTLALVRGLNEPIRVVLFFAPASDVEARVRPYFEQLAAASKSLVVEQADQALDPELSKTLRVSANGTIALVQGEQVERVNVGTELSKARSMLRKLDETVQGRLLKLTRKSRTVYFTVGHDEAQWSGSDIDSLRKLSGFKQILESLNYGVKELGLEQGLGREVPDDAAVVVIAGARRPFLPEELDTLRRYIEGGGRIFLLMEPGHPDPAELTALLGGRFHGEILHHDRAFVRRSRTDADQALTLTNRYSSHPSVGTLSKLSNRLVLITPESGWLESVATEGLRVTETVRSMPGTWADTDGNHRFDGDTETRKNFAVGLAAERKTERGELRAALLANLAAVSDGVITNQANYQYVTDTMRWLTDDEALAGTVEREEDVHIEHTRDGDKAWFYGTTFGVPLLIVSAGLVRVRRRRRRAA